MSCLSFLTLNRVHVGKYVWKQRRVRTSTLPRARTVTCIAQEPQSQIVLPHISSMMRPASAAQTYKHVQLSQASLPLRRQIRHAAFSPCLTARSFRFPTPAEFTQRMLLPVARFVYKLQAARTFSKTPWLIPFLKYSPRTL